MQHHSNEVVRVIRPPSLGAVEVLRISESARAWRVYHETYALALDRNHRPCAEWWYRGRVYTARPGIVGLLEPGELHVTKKTFIPGTIDAVQIQAEFVEGIAREMGLVSTPHFRTGQSAAPMLERALRALCDSLDEAPSELEQQTLLFEVVRLSLQHGGERAIATAVHDEPDRVRRARDYLHVRAHERVTLEELAAVAGLSRYHLVRSFARAYGLPPHAYQNELRLADARAAIRAGMPLSSLDVGFADQSHLLRHFKKAMAMTPGRYARMVGAMSSRA